MQVVKKPMTAKMDLLIHPYLCMVRGCIAIASHAPKVMMPCEQGAPVPLIIGVRLCHHHCKTADPYGLIDREDVKTFVSKICRAKGLLRPDWDKAFVVAIPLESDEYRRFEEMRT